MVGNFKVVVSNAVVLKVQLLDYVCGVLTGNQLITLPFILRHYLGPFL